MTKPTKWVCAQRRLRSAWASAQSDHSLRCPHDKAWVLSCSLSTQRRLWSDWADDQADLSLRWVHSHFVGLVMRRLIWFLIKQWSLLRWSSSFMKRCYLWIYESCCCVCVLRPSTLFRSFRAWSVSLSTLLLGKPPKQFTSTQCTFFRQ